MSRSGSQNEPVRCIGVTGHRPNRLPPGQLMRVVEDTAQVMAKLAKNQTSRFVLASGLAEGADRLAAYTALGLGWDLRAILAFHRIRFEKDFQSALSRGEFRALLSASAVVEEPAKKWHIGRPAEDGYDAVGARLLETCDTLIAIWDGEASQGRGGTVEVIEAARSRGISVIWINAAQATAPQQLDQSAGPTRQPRGPA